MPTRQNLFLCALAAGAFTFSFATEPVHADNQAAAEATFQKGKAHMDAGRYQEACEAFQVSGELDPSVGTSLNLGECYVKLGRTASAWAAFKEAMGQAKRERQNRRLKYAQKRAADTEATLTKLKVIAPNAPEDLSVLRDDLDMSKLIGVEIPVDPGSYTFKVSAPGHETWTEEREVKGEGELVVVELPALQPAKKEDPVVGNQDNNNTEKPEKDSLVATTSTSSTSTTSKSGSSRKTWAMVSGGAGIAFVATGLVLGGVARSKWNQAQDRCDTDLVCDSTGVTRAEDADRYANYSNITVGVGIAAVAAGAVLWFTAPSEEESSKTVATPLISSDQLGFALSGSF